MVLLCNPSYNHTEVELFINIIRTLSNSAVLMLLSTMSGMYSPYVMYIQCDIRFVVLSINVQVKVLVVSVCKVIITLL